MKKVLKKMAAILLAAMLLCSLMAPAMAADSKGIETAKNGTVYVELYLHNAGYYYVMNNKWMLYQSFGDTPWSSGSGFFVGKKGENPSYIVTNHHVVADYITAEEGGYYEEATDHIVQDQNGNKYRLYVRAESCEMRVYYDDDDYDIAYLDCYGDMEKVDLAVLTIRKPTDKRNPLQIYVPTPDMVGDTVYTVGFPGNADNDFTSASSHGVDDVTVHKGSITKFVANDKGVERIQTDAVIQHGNSGGPLVSESGAVLGVDTNVWSQVQYETQVEADYYAINASELVKFLDKNNIPYEMAKAGGSVPIGLIVGIVAAVAVVAVVAVVLVMKKKSPAPAVQGAQGVQAQGVQGMQGGPQPAQMAGTPQAAAQMAGRPQAAQRSFIRSMAAQHNGMAVVVGAEPILIGRDPSTCKLVYAAGTSGVSGHHCTVSYDPANGVFLVTDLRSTYGTFLSTGQKMDPNIPYRIKPGDCFYVGDRANGIRVELG